MPLGGGGSDVAAEIALDSGGDRGDDVVFGHGGDRLDLPDVAHEGQAHELGADEAAAGEAFGLVERLRGGAHYGSFDDNPEFLARGRFVAGDLEDGLEHWPVVRVLPVAKHPADELFAEFVLRCLPGGDDLVEEALRRCGGGVEEAYLGVVVVIDED